MPSSNIFPCSRTTIRFASATLVRRWDVKRTVLGKVPQTLEELMLRPWIQVGRGFV